MKVDMLNDLLSAVQSGETLSPDAPEVARQAAKELRFLLDRIQQTARERDDARQKQAEASDRARANDIRIVAAESECDLLRAQVLKCAEETQKACSEAAQYKEWFTRAEEELQETRARADKTEADLASCLAATNEALEEALTHGREAEDGPNRALAQAVRAAARLGAEEMQKTAVSACRLEEEKWALAANGYNNPLTKERHTARSGVAADLVVIITALPLPGDEMKPKRPPSHSMHCLPLGLGSWRCGYGCTIRKGEEES